MKKVLIISAVFPPEPVVSANISSDLATELSKKYDVKVLRPRPTRPLGFTFKEKSYVNTKYEIIELSSYTCPKSKLFGRFMESYSMGRCSAIYIRKNKDSISLIYNGAWPLFGQILISRVAKKYGIPIICPVQDIYPESLTNKMPFFRSLLNLLLFPLDKYVLGNATKINTISDKIKNHLVITRKIAPKKIVVVQNWQDEEKFIEYNMSKHRILDQQTPFTFMYLGNIGPVAGIGLLIEAFANANLNNCRLVIAGAGSMKEILQKKTVELNCNNIEFWSVSEGMVPEIQDQADVMLLPIRKGAAMSSIPSKLPAYMFSKKPIIACVETNSDIANAILIAQCGWVTPPDNRKNLIQTMKMVSVLPKEELKQKGDKGFEFAITNFSRKTNLKKLINIFSETINE